MRNRHALNGNRDLVRVLHLGHLVGFHGGPRNVLLFEIFLNALHGQVGILFDRVLHLNLQNQVGTALQVQPQPDIVLNVLGKLGTGLGETNDADNAKQECDGNDDGARR